MPDALSIVLIAGIAVVVVLQIVALMRKPRSEPPPELLLRLQDVEQATQALHVAVGKLEGALQGSAASQAEHLRGLTEQMRGFTATAGEGLERVRGAVDLKLSQASEDAGKDRQEMGAALQRFEESFGSRFDGFGRLLGDRLDVASEQIRSLAATTDQKLEAVRNSLESRFGTLTASNAEALTAVRTAVDTRLAAIQADNTAKLDEMRRTVDEKLHATLEQRLGESFKLVSERLEQVHRGLGEMQTLAAGVGDLKRVLTNVKTRGVWGEVQLASLLEQILSPEQYGTNVATRPRSGERVEFAIRLPGNEDGVPVWLPIDAKFPVEDYQRLLDAQERADAAAAEAAARAVETRLRDEARTIREKYVEPPHTTDFAILYLPIEGLYAEALRRPGLAEALQREHRVTLAGPTTLAAMLNSLQMGFRTLAIEKRSSEVWAVLGAVKTEFGKFGEALSHTRRKLEEATNSIGKAETRTRALSRKLREVEALPEEQAVALLGGGTPLPEDGASGGDAAP